jgi:hypothetical protein
MRWKTFSLRGLGSAVSVLAVAVIGLAPGRANAENTSDKYLEFRDPAYYDRGDQISVALHSSGLVLEFHQKDVWSDTVYYRIGSINGNGVSWGPARNTERVGYWPTGALTKEGYVVLVFSLSSSRPGSELFYRIGKIDPNGDTNQTIEWKTDTLHWDGGFHSSIAINDNGVIVAVHESNNRSNNDLHYRVGHIAKSGSNYWIQWDSGHGGIRYDSGRNPHIAINNHNQVVEIHQTATGNLLHYRRGTINFDTTSATIDFGESQRYDDSASQAAVALLDNGLALEVHTGSNGMLFSRVGQPSTSDSAIIEWHPKRLVDSDIGEYPAIATNGAYAVEIHQCADDVTDLFYSVAEVGDLENSMAE